jgi:Flp pilus assembly protein TadB
MDEPRHTEAPPPPAEHVHLPEPSYLPVAVAFGLTLALVGLVVTWILLAIGVVIFAIAVLRWVRETREDIAELPIER